MEVCVRHRDTGDSCVVGVPEGGTVIGLKADALDEMFPGCINPVREAACVAAHIEGCEEELDDAQRVADTGLEDGGAVQLVPRWPKVKAPAVYSSTHGGEMRRITLSRCGMLCAVGYFNGHITVFDTITAAVVADLSHGNTTTYGIAFSVCGTWLATCSDDGTICVWLASSWEEVTMLDHNTTVYSAAWSRSGRLVSGDCNGQMRVWDLKGTPSATVLVGHSDAVRSIAVSGTRIFSGSGDKTIRVWDISTLRHTRTLDEHTRSVSDVALTKDEQHLVSCSWDNSLKVWCTTSLRCLRTVQLATDLFYSLAVSQPGDVVAVGTPTTSTTALYRLSTGEHLGRVDSKGYGVALSLCGRWVFTPTRKTSVSVCPRAVP